MQQQYDNIFPEQYIAPGHYLGSKQTGLLIPTNSEKTKYVTAAIVAYTAFICMFVVPAVIPTCTNHKCIDTTCLTPLQFAHNSTSSTTPCHITADYLCASAGSCSNVYLSMAVIAIKYNIIAAAITIIVVTIARLV